MDFGNNSIFFTATTRGSQNSSNVGDWFSFHMQIDYCAVVDIDRWGTWKLCLCRNQSMMGDFSSSKSCSYLIGLFLCTQLTLFVRGWRRRHREESGLGSKREGDSRWRQLICGQTSSMDVILHYDLWLWAPWLGSCAVCFAFLHRL